MVKQEQKRREESKKRASGSSNQQNRGSNSNNGGRKRNLKRPTPKKKKGSKKGEKRESVTSIQIPENVRVYEFAEKIGKTTGEVIKVLFTLGTMFTQNDFLDKDSIEILAEEFGTL